MTQCAVEERRNLELAIPGSSPTPRPSPSTGPRPVFADGDDTPWSKAFLASAYASRGVKVRFTSGTGSEALMGHAQGLSMLYLEARCVSSCPSAERLCSGHPWRRRRIAGARARWACSSAGSIASNSSHRWPWPVIADGGGDSVRGPGRPIARRHLPGGPPEGMHPTPPAASPRPTPSRTVAARSKSVRSTSTSFPGKREVDIALMALSPAVNAPTTAVQVIDHLGETLREIGTTETSRRRRRRSRACRPRSSFEFVAGRTSSRSASPRFASMVSPRSRSCAPARHARRAGRGGAPRASSGGRR